VLPRVGADVWISFGTTISHPTAEFGRSVYVGPYGMLGDVTLEDDVLLGSNVSIMNGSEQHGIERLDIPIREQPGRWPRVTIGCDSWIGDRSIVMADVGKHCVIGAGSVVTKPIPDYSIAVGSPAKVVRDRREKLAQSNESSDDASESLKVEVFEARSSTNPQ
jgi:acetyltransferase-like isoleucine patch superfamily enzyme